MEIIRIMLTVVWFIFGVINLLKHTPITRTDYGCIWIIAMVCMIEHCVEGVV